MAIYYVDFAVAPGGAGTEQDPFGFDDILSHKGLYNEFMCRGQIEKTGNLLLSPATGIPHYMKPWNASLYGPWRLRATGSIEFTPDTVERHCWIYGGIIESESFIRVARARGCYLRALGGNGYGIRLALGTELLGCYLRSIYGYTYYAGSFYIKDCALDKGINFKAKLTTIINSAFSGAVTGTALTFEGDNQFNWVAPTAPTWDAEASAYLPDDILAGVTKPQPYTGTIPYTGYDKGLFGLNRFSIGVAYYGIAPEISVQPQTQFKQKGETAEFTIAAVGAPEPSYQWRSYTDDVANDLVDGGRISGALTQTLQIADVEESDETRYDCKVSNGVNPDAYSNEVWLKVNNKPHITSPGCPKARVKTKYICEMAAEDVDPDTLVWSLLQKPDGMIIDSETGLITWRPLKKDLGDHIVEVQVDDGHGGTDTLEWTLTVTKKRYWIFSFI